MDTSALPVSELSQAPSVAALLKRRADLTPSRPFIRTAARDISYEEMWQRVSALASGLSRLGVRQGDVVAMSLPNGPEFIETWFATVAIGAVSAPLNTGLSGTLLSQVMTLCEAPVLVVSAHFLDRVRRDIPDLEPPLTIVVVQDANRVADGGVGVVDNGLAARLVSYEEVAASGDSNPLVPQIASAQGQLLFTSGTSGSSPSGCIISNGYAVNQAIAIMDWLNIAETDVLYGALPMFHVASCKLATAAALVGGVFAPGEWFDVNSFWSRMRETKATIFPYASATIAALWHAPPTTDDHDNPVRVAFGVPIPPWAREFEARFNLDLATAYGSTEVVTVAFQPAPSTTGELVGRPRSSLEVVVADDEDRVLPPRELGEILVRPRNPREMMDGYYKDPALTLSRMNNLWFHTHDLGWFDETGNLYYKGRKGDMLRRKGENISPLQIENQLALHVDILECAVCGVPSDFLDDEVMAVVRMREGASSSAQDILDFCMEQLPSFMVPRYLYVASEPLPRSASGKVAKYRLKDMYKVDGVLDRFADR